MLIKPKSLKSVWFKPELLALLSNIYRTLNPFHALFWWLTDYRFVWSYHSARTFQNFIAGCSGAMLLVFPFIPVAVFMRFSSIEKVVLWEILDFTVCMYVHDLILRKQLNNIFQVTLDAINNVMGYVDPSGNNYFKVSRLIKSMLYLNVIFHFIYSLRVSRRNLICHLVKTWHGFRKFLIV